MGDTIAFVQRSYDSRYELSLINNPGRPVRGFVSSGAAQKAAENASGRTLRWTQIEALPVGERWRGDDPSWWPADLGDGVTFWLRSDRGVYLADVASGELVVAGIAWSSIAPGGDGFVCSPAGTGTADTLVENTQQSSQLPAVRMYGTQVRLDSDYADLEPPFTIAVAARYEPDVGVARRELLSSSTFAFRVTTATGLWSCLTNGTSIAGPAASATLDVLSATVTTSLTTFYVNGVEIGSSADVPVGAIGTISLGSATERWSGDIYQVVIVDRELSEMQHLRRLVPYMQRNRR